MIGLLFPSILFSLLLLTAVYSAPTNRGGSRFVAWTLGIVFVLGLLTATPLVAWHAGLTMLFIALERVSTGYLWGRRTLSTAAMFAAAAIVVYTGALEAERLADQRDQLRQQFPLESVAHRLAYETAAAEKAGGRPATDGPPQLAAEVERELYAAETRGQYASRARFLARIHHHDQKIDRSTAAWMFSRTNDDLRIDDSEPNVTTAPPRRSGGCGPSHEPAPEQKPEPQYVPQPSPADAPPEYASASPSISAPPRDLLAALHQSAGDDFLNPERFGFVRDREHVAGFEPHAFTSMPTLGMPTPAKPENVLMFGGAHGGAADSPADWKLERVDLVSLRKASGPAVYLSENLPKVAELKTADTRLLDDFESRALARLRTDENVVIEQADGLVRMLGALRADNNCIRCHTGLRGELIGAISYEFHHKNHTPQLAEQ
jgi:hypothetical protein